jgi:ATP-binding cassette subfamily B protein RaxB
MATGTIAINKREAVVVTSVYPQKSSKLTDNQAALRKLNFKKQHSTPLILQSEIAECGLACIGMVASHHGHKINLPGIRTFHSVGSQGMKLADVIDVGDKFGLASRALKCPIDEINRLVLPCIIHWDLDHYVVLTRVDDGKVELNDPARGRRKLTVDEFGDHYTGIALELTPTSAFKKADRRILMRLSDLWERAVGFKQSIALLIALSVVLQVFSLTLPYYTQWTVDKVLLTNDQPLLTVLALSFAALIVIQAALAAFRSWIVVRLTTSLSLQMGANLFRHLLKLPLNFFSSRHIGEIISRFGSLSEIKELLTNNVVEIFIDGVMALFILGVMYLYDAKLACIALIVTVLAFLIELGYFYPIRKIKEELINDEAKEDTVFLETIRSIQTIKLYNQSNARLSNWLNRNTDVLNSNIRLSKLEIGKESMIKTLFGLEGIFLLYLGAHSVINGGFTIGMLLAFLSYKTLFTSCAKNFIDKGFEFRLLSLHLERLADITLHQTERQIGQTAKQKTKASSVQLINLGYRHEGCSEFLFRNINLQVTEGESVALTGPSGCGKSTLLKVVLGVLPPTEGRVLIDGEDIADLDLGSVRSKIGSVMQNDSLLSGTVIDNITLFEPNYDQEKLDNAIHLSGLWDDLDNLPLGGLTLIGDMGSTLSGGQAQRVYLARALYFSPSLLVLDEATSHLDQNKESEVNDKIRQLNLTRIMVAHRKETIESADRVVDITAL